MIWMDRKYTQEANQIRESFLITYYFLPFPNSFSNRCFYFLTLFNPSSNSTITSSFLTLSPYPSISRSFTFLSSLTLPNNSFFLFSYSRLRSRSPFSGSGISLASISRLMNLVLNSIWVSILFFFSARMV